MTHKLFHDDVNIREFDADVVACEPAGDGHYKVWLDRTAFYAEAGGQPCDLGVLGNAPVLDVQEDEDGDIYHLTSAPLSGSVHGTIDWRRRFSHMQQHSGQHLLSWAIYNQLGGYTYGLHIGADEVTIDTDLKQAPDRAALDALERAVNRIIWCDYATRQWFPTDEELSALPLRKKPTVDENIRIVMTGDFECVACCGTHTTSTGQIGLITILGAHPARGKTRFSFLCGERAYARLRAEADACRAAGALLSTGYENLEAETGRVVAQLKESEHALSLVRQREAVERALQALEHAEPTNGIRTVCLRLDNADRDALIKAASALTENEGVVALLSAGGAESGDIAVFACSGDVKADMGALLRETLKPLGGRGGGRPNFAQGGAPCVIDESALSEAVAHLNA